MEKAFALLDEMAKKGLEPDILCYNTLIDGFCKSGDILHARKVFNIILDKGLVPDCMTYTALIDGNCKIGDITDAFDLYNEMLARGVVPDAYVYAALTAGCSNSADLEQAVFITEEMFVRGYASVSCFNTLVHGFCKRGKIQETLKLFCVMMDKDIVPNALTIENVINGLGEAGKLCEAHTIFVELQQKESSQSATTQFSLLFMEMINKGLIPLNIIDDVIQAHCKEGDLDKALMLHHAVMEEGSLMSCSTYIALVDGLCRAGKLTEALDLLKEIQKLGIHPNEDQCLMLLNDLHTSGYIQEYNKVFDAMLCHKWLQKDKHCNLAGVI
jgi:leucine-rich PPR motif-containing protein